MPHLFRTLDSRIWKAGQPVSLWRADGSCLEGIWGGSATEERLDWWLRKPGNELVQTAEISAVAVKGEDSGEIRWGETPAGTRLFFVLEAPVVSRSGETYRIAKMVTTAATPAQAAYFQDERFALLGILHSDGSMTRIPPLPPPEPEPPAQPELF